MNTGFLNKFRLLANNRSRALLIGQTLCLIVVAAIFVVSPFVVMAACGQQSQQQKQQNAILNTAKQTKNIQIASIIKSVSPKLVPGALNESTLPLNGKLPAGVTMDGSVTIVPFTNQKQLQIGDWVMIKQSTATGTIMYPATIFGESKINGQDVIETWPAETPLAATPGLEKSLIPVGHKIFVTLQNFTAGTTIAKGN